jgi:hypothetical protein
LTDGSLKDALRAITWPEFNFIANAGLGAGELPIR